MKHDFAYTGLVTVAIAVLLVGEMKNGDTSTTLHRATVEMPGAVYCGRRSLW